jgi:hypothetical protein
MPRLTALSLLALLALARVAGAQLPPPQKAQPTLGEAVEACVASVRKESTGAGITISHANAHVKSGDQVAFFGSTKEHSSFRKCLSEKGQ